MHKNNERVYDNTMQASKHFKRISFVITQHELEIIIKKCTYLNSNFSKFCYIVYKRTRITFMELSLLLKKNVIILFHVS